jgi:Putative Actinobacterial Holin-X, holin superfamily III
VAASTRSSSADLAAGLVEDAQRLVQLEIALAKQELKELAIRNAVAAGLLGGAAFLATVAVFVGVPLLITLLVPDHVVAVLVWIGIYFGGAVVLGVAGRLLLNVKPPERTLASLRETKEWVVRQISSTGR